MLSTVCRLSVLFDLIPHMTLSQGLTGKKEGKTRLMNMVMQVGLI